MDSNLLTSPGTRFLFSFPCHACLFGRKEEAQALGRGVDTPNDSCHNCRLYVPATLDGKLHCLINTSELDEVCLQSLIPFARLVKSSAPQQEKWRKLWILPLTISVSTSSVWIPSELNPWPLPLVPEPGSCPRAAVHPPGYTLTCELCLASEAPATDPVHRLHRRKETQDGKLPLIASHARGCIVLKKSWHPSIFKSITTQNLYHQVHILLRVTLDWPGRTDDSRHPNFIN